MQPIKAFNYSDRFPDYIPLVGSAFSKDHPDAIPLSFGFPAPETFPIQVLTDASTKALQVEGGRSLQYTGSDGREKVVDWIKYRSRLRAIEVETDNILVTSGSMQAIDLATRTLTNEGDEIWLEAPTFFGATRIFRLAGAALRTFPVDEDGVDVDAIEAALVDAVNNDKQLPKMIYCMPNYHNPTGVNLSIERRKRLAKLAYQYNFYILEDDAYVDLNFSNIHVPSIYSFAQERVIYLSTFSKIIAPGIRVGWAIANQHVISKMKVLKVDGTTSVFVQEIVANLLEEIHFETHLTKIITLYRERCEAMVMALDKYFGSEINFVVPKGGFFIWVTFPSEVDTNRLQRACMEQGVSFISGEDFYVDQMEYNHIRLCFTFCNDSQIERAIKRMADVYFYSKNNVQHFQEAE